MTPRCIEGYDLWVSRTTDATRVFRAGSFSFAVESNQPHLRRAVEQLFGDLADGAVPDARFCLTDEPRGTRLTGGDLVPFTYRRDTSAVLDELVTAINRLMLDHGDGRLHLHAGAVANGTAAVLVSAPSGTGKTTLITTLAQRGWTYVTDEAVSLSMGDPQVKAFPKPLSIKPGGQLLLPHLEQHRITLGGTDSDLWQVPVSALGVATAGQCSPTLIVVLTREPADVAPTYRTLDPSDAAVALVEQSLDFERYGPLALHAIAELCARCRCVLLNVGAPEDTAELVEEIASHVPDDALPVTPFVVGRDGIVDPQVTSIAIGLSTVAYSARTKRCLSLNAEGTTVWTQLCNGGPPPHLERSPFLAQLEHEGFIAAGLLPQP